MRTVTAVVWVLILIALGACSRGPAPGAVERGKYLVTAMGCGDCHTPLKMGEHGPEPDTSRLLSGHPKDLQLEFPSRLSESWPVASSATNTAWAGPWGVSYTSNLTSDPETGIGSWSEQTFIQALRTGRHTGAGRALLPPMPWQAVGQLTDEDLAAIFAYLKTVPPVHNSVPSPLSPAR
jgi:mono/diheme cytochrome c family protein